MALAGTGVVGQFGAEGSGDGQIAQGGGAGVYDATGDVYVADVGNLRIERFSANGSFERAFGWGVANGSPEAQVCTSNCRAGLGGEGAGQFSSPIGPRAIAVDQADGSVYVIDAANYRIEKFDADGNFQRAWGWGVADGSSALQVCTTTCRKGLSGAGAGEFKTITLGSLAVDPTDGNVLVTDPSNLRVQEFTSEGAFVRMFGRDVQTGGSTEFEVCTEAALCKVGTSGTAVGQFGSSSPRGIAVSSTGLIYTAEQGVRRIQKFTPSGGTLTPSLFLSSTLAPQQIAVDRSDDHVIASMSNLSSPAHGVEYDSSGAVVENYFGLGGNVTVLGLAVDSSSSIAYALGKNTVYVVGPMEQPTVAIQPVTDVTATSALAHATINSNGEPATHYRFEYSVDGVSWASTADAVVAGDSATHQIATEIAPPAGLEPGTTYRVRLFAEKPGNESLLTEAVEFTTQPSAPLVETVGSPYRTATTAQLEARVNPRGQETSYRFEYGPTAAYGNSAPVAAEATAGSGFRSVLAAQEVTGLQPGATYHYRVVATNPTGTVLGNDMTVTTRASDQPLTHGHLPGPPGSDRAYEQVNLPDTGGNPVLSAYGFSDDGDRAIYQVSGGTPESENGTLFNQFFAERTASGWKSKLIWPPRSAVSGAAWVQPFANDDLSKMLAQNQFPGVTEWLLAPDAAPQKLLDITEEQHGGFFGASDDLSRFVIRLKGPIDPEHPTGPGNAQLYDFTTGTPHLISLLPDGSVPSCGVPLESDGFNLPTPSPRRSVHWISADGSRVFFPSAGDTSGCAERSNQLYMRNLVAGTTARISPPAISGSECPPAFIKSTAESAFFWTQARLVAEDNAPTNCPNLNADTTDGDVYRYDFADGAVSCLTCVVPNADVLLTTSPAGASAAIAVAEDGSRVYFSSARRLVEGEGVAGSPNAYRLDVATGDLKFVSPNGSVGDLASFGLGQAINPDGSVILFPASGEAMNAITSGDNGGKTQYYRYDDRDGSLACISCPLDGGPGGEIGKGVNEEQLGPNLTPMDEAGDIVFATTAPLIANDQNTPKEGEDPAAGNDVYEWRDGRVLLVTDGQTSWPGDSLSFAAPGLAGITPSGRDVFFLAAEQLTPDAIDGFKRLYDARIGGGFEFPGATPPCPLEVCQGEAKGAPTDPTPGSQAFQGRGNVPAPDHPRRHRRKCRKHRGHSKRCSNHHTKKRTHKSGRAH